MNKNLVKFYPKMTSDESPYIATSNELYSKLRRPFNAFDGTNEDWASKTVSGWLKIDFKEKKKFSKIYIKGDKTARYSPKDFTIEVSNDDINWEIAQRIKGVSWENNEVKVFSIELAEKGYRYYKINITANNSGLYSTITDIYFDELIPINKSLILHDGEYKKWNPEVVDNHKSIIPAMTSYNSPSGVVEESSNYGTAYRGWQAFDKITNKHANGSWHTKEKAPQWISYQSIEEKCVTKLRITSRIDSLASSQGLKDFSLQGFNESTNQWEDVFTRTGEVSWGAGETREFVFNNTKKYKKHRLYISATTGTSAFAVTEIDFLEALTVTEEEWTAENLSDIESEGMDSLSPLLDRRIQTLKPLPMEDKSDLFFNSETGKVFSGTINLKKYLDIRSVSPK